MDIGRIRNGAILISTGVVLLLNTTGHLLWSVWLRIFSLWPVALIAIGIELLFKKTRFSFLTVLSPLLFFVIILGPAFLHKTYFDKIYRASHTYYWSQDLDTTMTRTDATIRFNAGNLVVSSGTDKLISAELDYFKRKPLIIYERENLNGSGRVRITDRDKKLIGWNFTKGKFWGGWGEKRWEIKITDVIPIDLRVSLKASNADLDFSELRVSNFDLETKASKVDIKMGALVDDVIARVESKASKLSLALPEDMAIRIINHTNLSSTSFSWLTLEKTEDGYQTVDFDRASRKLTLYLEGSLTSLKISKYQPFERI